MLEENENLSSGCDVLATEIEGLLNRIEYFFYTLVTLRGVKRTLWPA